MSTDTITAPYRIEMKLAKWENHRTPDDGDPDEIITSSAWYEGGVEITDPVRIAQLEAEHPPTKEE
jgi:hypothetical protein